MSYRLSVTKWITVARSKADALRFIWDIQNIEKTELKVVRLQIHRTGDKTGTYHAEGRFAGIPWADEFSYLLNDNGFHSANVAGTVQGGFVVGKDETHSDATHCRVTHYEQYEVPGKLWALKPAIYGYLSWSMKQELIRMREMILAPVTARLES